MATLLRPGGMVNGAAAQPAAAATAKPSHRVVRLLSPHRPLPDLHEVGSSINAVLRPPGRELQQGGSMDDARFQDPRNQADTDAFRITVPTLVVIDVQNSQVINWKPLPKVWSLVGNRMRSPVMPGEVRAFLAASEGSAKSVTAK